MPLDINFGEVNIPDIFSGLGSLLKSVREAITGEAIVDANKKAELLLKAQELEAQIEQARISVMVAEAKSQDKWTSRARPAFMYVIYIMLLASLPFAGLAVYDETAALKYVQGFHNWLNAIPSDLYALFGAGYLGYAGLRTYEKRK